MTRLSKACLAFAAEMISFTENVIFSSQGQRSSQTLRRQELPAKDEFHRKLEPSRPNWSNEECEDGALKHDFCCEEMKSVFAFLQASKKTRSQKRERKKLMQFLKNVFCFFSKILFIFWQKSQLLFFMSLKTLRKIFCCNFNCAESHSGLSGLQKFLITHVLAFLYFCKFCGLGFDSWIIKLLVAKQGMLSAYTNLSKPNWRLIFVYYVPNSSLISMFASSMAQLEFIVPPMLRQVISQLSQTSSINWAITASAKKL